MPTAAVHESVLNCLHFCQLGDMIALLGVAALYLVDESVMRSGKGMSAGELLKQANQLKRSGRLDEAIALYYHLIDINPQFAWAYHGLGDALVKQEYFDEAINYFNQAVEINPNIASFYYYLSEVMARQGKINQAVIYFDKFLEINFKSQSNFPDNGYIEKFLTNQITEESLWDALKSAHLLGHHNQVDSAINLYQKIIKDSLYQYSEIHNKLGELFLKNGDTKKAVDTFHVAIRLAPDIANYHINLAEATNNWILSTKSYRTSVKLDSVAYKNYYNTYEINYTGDIQVKNPIFIVGCGHSGTSVMLALLGSHPYFYPIPYESALFMKNTQEIEKVMKCWDQDCFQDGKSRWVEKTPSHILQIGKLLKFRPESNFIIMLRDGRDVVCSLKDRVEYSSFRDQIYRWVYDNLAGKIYWNDHRVKVVKYENLVTNPEMTMKDIFDFLGEKYNNKIFDFHKIEKRWYSPEIVKPEKINSLKTHQQYRNWQINQPLFDGRGRWQQDMKPGEKIIFKKIAQHYLLEWGYVKDDNW